jgi:hypothetical protein
VKRRLVTIATVTLAVLAAITGRVVCSSRAEWTEGRAEEARALRQGDAARRAEALEAAIVHYRRAVRWYAPGNAYGVRALDALERIGRRAERQGDMPTALSAYRAIRSAILGARSVYTPHAERLGPANQRIAKLSAALQASEQRTVDPGQLEAWHLAQLRKDTAPSVGWSVLAVLAFLGWVAGAFLFVYRAITPDDRLVPRQALIWGGVILGNLLLWLLGLSQA